VPRIAVTAASAIARVISNIHFDLSFERVTERIYDILGIKITIRRVAENDIHKDAENTAEGIIITIMNTDKKRFVTASESSRK
jgi:hypothetical protein